MNKAIRIILCVVGFCLLIGVRLFEETLFYDPLTQFFKHDYSNAMLPGFKMSKLMIHLAFRYFINTILSLFILWFAFKKAEIVKLSTLLYVALFLLLAGFYNFLINSYQPGDYMLLFYVRRFLIQPLFLLILIPAFYFQKKA